MRLSRPPVPRRFVVAAVVLAASLGVSGCGAFPFGCTDELGLDVDGAPPQLAVGESFSPRVTEITCGGRERTRRRMEWTAEDPAIVAVDNAANRVTGLAPGPTRIVGQGPVGEISLSVRVVAR
jgi:hypothetical protein